MNISDILKYKAESARADVASVAPSDTVADLLAALAENNVGALVVLDGDAVAGIASERDVVRRIAADGAGVLEREVREIMTTAVVSCASGDDVEHIAEIMTERRIRHMPVIDDGQLTGIMSIGDVVSSHIRELKKDREHMEQYISG